MVYLKRFHLVTRRMSVSCFKPNSLQGVPRTDHHPDSASCVPTAWADGFQTGLLLRFVFSEM